VALEPRRPLTATGLGPNGYVTDSEEGKGWRRPPCCSRSRPQPVRMATATGMTECSILRVQKETMVRILPALSPRATAAFLRHVLVPAVRRAGWTLARVLTDRGNEFKADFAGTCATLGIRQTRIKTRHAWTNGFVERLQGTILQEHWRVEFRRRYFTSRRALQRSLDGFLHFYNHARPHQGYRVRGRTPASIFWGAVSA
jgi:transposase InsO family protein